MAKLFTEIDSNKNTSGFQKIYTWNAPERHWIERTKAWYVSYSLFFVVVIAAAAILQELILIVAIIAFTFLWFTQAAIPPERVNYSITTIGIRAFQKIFKWKNIKHFWFSTKENVIFLNLDIIDEELFESQDVRRLSLIVNPEDEVKIFNILIEYIDYGDKDEIKFNILLRMLNGKYRDITNYLPEKEDDYEEFFEDEVAIEPKIKIQKKKTRKTKAKSASK